MEKQVNDAFTTARHVIQVMDKYPDVKWIVTDKGVRPK